MHREAPQGALEGSGLRLLYASLIMASRSWKGMKMTPDIWWELGVLRREAFGEPVQHLEREAVAV